MQLQLDVLHITTTGVISRTIAIGRPANDGRQTAYG
jgi:hypothetical protein